MLRTVDANLNRIGEGLRILEDISRFILDDGELSEQLKSLRHELLPTDPVLREKLLASRRAGEDVGAFLDVDAEAQRADAASLVTANSQRVQQSLRVLEEIAKLPDQDSGLDWEAVKRARFILYDLEKRIVLKLLRRDRTARISGLYVIVDVEVLKGRNEVDVADQAIRGGARIIQLRDKVRTKREILSSARELKRVCAARDVLFIVNDHVDVALASGADGLHIGQEDLPLEAARKLLPVDRVIGCSTANLPEALEADEKRADYVAVGSIYPTPTKPGTRLAGLEILRQVKTQVSAPVVAIGGINEDNVAEVVRAGADAIAVVNAVLGAENVTEASQRLAARIEEG
jgi:thiamine-phosphate pyrophosphorylase